VGGAQTTGASQWLPEAGCGPAWHRRLLGGGGHSVVTRIEYDAGLRSDSCSLERKGAADRPRAAFLDGVLLVRGEITLLKTAL
jgi:hypothetical protein